MFRINCQRRSVIVTRNDFSSSALRITQLSVSVISVLNSDIPTSQSALQQSYTKDTNGQNNDDKAKKPTLGSHSISVNYCNILVYFRITHNKFKATLTVLSYDFWFGLPLHITNGITVEFNRSCLKTFSL